MRNLFPLSAAALVLTLAPAAQETPAPFEITQEVIDGIVAEARPAVEKALGVEPGRGFEGARLAETDEIKRVLGRENLPLMRKQFEDPAVAEAQARQFAETLAPALLAKFAFEEREILISPSAFRHLADVIGMPELQTEACLRGVIVHELVHAWDHGRYRFGERLQELENTDQIQAYNAVFEGHAQHAARGICAELGWSEGFEIFTRAIGARPKADGEDGGAGMDLLQRLQIETFASAYYRGETFIAAILEQGGEEAVARAFRDPPKDLGDIRHPEWFLNPELRPEKRFRLEAALDAFAETIPKKGWAKNRASVSAGQLEIAFSLLPEDVVTRITASLRHNRILTGSTPDQSKMRVALICEWGSPAEARFFVEASEKVMRKKDEEMAEGALKIVDAKYFALEEPALTGVAATKTIEVQSTVIVVTTLTAASGELTVELADSGEPRSVEKLTAIAQRVLAAAAAPASEEKDGEQGGGTSGGDGG